MLNVGILNGFAVGGILNLTYQIKTRYVTDNVIMLQPHEKKAMQIDLPDISIDDSNKMEQALREIQSDFE